MTKIPEAFLALTAIFLRFTVSEIGDGSDPSQPRADVRYIEGVTYRNTRFDPLQQVHPFTENS